MKITTWQNDKADYVHSYIQVKTHTLKLNDTIKNHKTKQKTFTGKQWRTRPSNSWHPAHENSWKQVQNVNHSEVWLPLERKRTSFFLFCKGEVQNVVLKEGIETIVWVHDNHWLKSIVLF